MCHFKTSTDFGFICQQQSPDVKFCDKAMYRKEPIMGKTTTGTEVQQDVPPIRNVL